MGAGCHNVGTELAAMDIGLRATGTGDCHNVGTELAAMDIGLRTTHRYIGVNRPLRPPSQRPSAPFSRKPLTLEVPFGAMPMHSRHQANCREHARPRRVVCSISVRQLSGSMG